MSAIVPGRPPTGEDEQARLKATAEHWRKVGYEGPVQAIGRIEDAAKQLIALNGTLSGLYFAIFTLSDLRKQVPSLALLLFFVPVALWLGSLYFATRVFLPEKRSGADLDDFSEGAWLKIRETYTKTRDNKLAHLNRSHSLLVASFGAILLLLVASLFLPGAPASGPTEMIILTPTPVP